MRCSICVTEYIKDCVVLVLDRALQHRDGRIMSYPYDRLSLNWSSKLLECLRIRKHWETL